jgi:single-strand DNA-binding protein
MSARSLNKVILIGNLTRDPELRYTPAGTAVCTIGLATNRSWVTQSGETREDTEFHKIVAWNKLGELCSQLLSKGRKIYCEGRLSTRSWTGQDGVMRSTTEIVIEDMIILDSKRPVKEEDGALKVAPTASVAKPEAVEPIVVENETPKIKPAKKKEEKEHKENVEKKAVSEDITPDDIPF